MKMGQVAIARLPHYTFSASSLIVQLQSKLDVSSRLRCLNDPRSRGLHRCVGYREIYAVKHIQEVRAELQLESLRELEVFLQAGIPVVVSGPAQRADLWRARAESNGIRIVAGIEPKEAAALGCGCVLPAKYGVLAVAIGAQSARARARLVLTVIV